MITISIGWFIVIIIGAFLVGLLAPLLFVLQLIWRAPLKK